MAKEKKVTDVGVIVGRFQVHELHDAHKDLIKSVQERHDETIIFLGLSPVRNTINNPLDFKSRKKMINEAFPDIQVYYIDDVHDDNIWSSNLDSQLSKWLNPSQSATLYGSRDSFLKCYHGRFPTCELESQFFISGTEIRRQVANSYGPSKDYRAGMIAATTHRYPTAFQAVDVAVMSDFKVLMARKSLEKKWRFIGGFSDPCSESLEDDTRREVKEESGVEIENIRYVGSRKINDWRYRQEKDCIKTALFVADYVSGKPEGADDVAECKWFSIHELNNSLLVEEHCYLLTMLKKYLNSNGFKINVNP